MLPPFPNVHGKSLPILKRIHRLSGMILAKDSRKPLNAWSRNVQVHIATRPRRRIMTKVSPTNLPKPSKQSWERVSVVSKTVETPCRTSEWLGLLAYPFNELRLRSRNQIIATAECPAKHIECISIWGRWLHRLVRCQCNRNGLELPLLLSNLEVDTLQSAPLIS